MCQVIPYYIFQSLTEILLWNIWSRILSKTDTRPLTALNTNVGFFFYQLLDIYVWIQFKGITIYKYCESNSPSKYKSSKARKKDTKTLNTTVRKQWQDYWLTNRPRSRDCSRVEFTVQQTGNKSDSK